MLYHKTCLILNNNNTIHEVFILHNCIINDIYLKIIKRIQKLSLYLNVVFFHCTHNPEQEVHVAVMFLSDENEMTILLERTNQNLKIPKG